MPQKIQPASQELTDFYRARSKWRSAGEESTRFRRAAALARVPNGAAVLDIGAREGGLRKYLPEDVKYQGIDITPEFASEAVMTRDISEGIPFPDGSYDFVFCIEVLEHVPNPFAAFGEINRVLRDGGVLIVSVPNPYHLKEIVWNLFRTPDRQGHIYSWTRQAMTKLGEMNGFRIDAYAGTYLHPPVPAPPLLARSVIYRFIKESAQP
ncbi:MAG: class I SAM-dependent methyltransferase [Gemmatimonadaceae bacterium]|nr:class I SAM-dependent methyltransferase [Gemmatimonadaceae bacterium]